jgi:hypothetical protein
VYYLSQPRDLRTLTLHRLEPATGEVTTVLSETGATRVEPNQWMTEPPILRVLADKVLWYSQRDGHLADAGCLADHVAALRQLAQTRPWMDLDRVGAFATARAMLDFPEVYKAGVALSGPHDVRYFNLCFVEAYDGADNPEAWARASNVDIADRLTGKLLLIHGEMDDQVHPDHTLRLADRLIAADKDFELLIVPGARAHVHRPPGLRPQALLGLPGARADGHATTRLPPRPHRHRPPVASALTTNVDRVC